MANWAADQKTVLYPQPHQIDYAEQQLAQTAITQPAMFVVEYALARLLGTWNVQPHAMMGHSLGEYVAACPAGVMSLPDALKLVAGRRQLVQQLPAGAMLAVESTAEQIAPFLGAGVDLAVLNGPRACVVAGTVQRMALLQEQLTAAGLRLKRLPTSHAFHSAMREPILAPFLALVREVQLHRPQRACITNVTGNWISAQEATDPAHWVRHLRQPVRFAEGLELLLAQPGAMFLEVGPGHTFTSIIRRHLLHQNALFAAPTLASTPAASDHTTLLSSLGRLWLAGNGRVDKYRPATCLPALAHGYRSRIGPPATLSGEMNFAQTHAFSRRAEAAFATGHFSTLAAPSFWLARRLQ